MAWSKTKDIPLRWEWRTFSPSLADLEARIGLAVQIAPRQSDEIYLLNSATPHSAKIRGGVLEVKRLEQVDPSGLDLWSPAFKAGFPLPGPMVQSAFSALGLPHPIIQRGVYTLDEFLAEIVDRNPLFRSAQVSKWRRQFTFGGCAAELVRLRIGAIAQDSFCIEDEAPGHVIAALRELGLDSHANINFPAGLERALARPA
jgi:exopolyphosphatase/guanosine-5'-triphosphate,3'-diphosphate pyrophosphatase